MSRKQPKILNIDDLAPEHNRFLKLAGVEYPIPEMTVENFIKTTKAAEDMKAAGAGAREQVVAMIDLIVRSLVVPTDGEPALRAALGGLDIERLGIVVEFIQGDYDPNKDPELKEGKAEAPATAATPAASK